MSTYDYEPDPKYYGPEPRHISHGFRKVGREGMTFEEWWEAPKTVATFRSSPKNIALQAYHAGRNSDTALLRMALEGYESMYGRKPERIEKIITALRERLGETG